MRRLVLGVVVSVASAAVAGGQTPSCVVPAAEGAAPGLIRATLRPAGKRPPPHEYTASVLEAIGEHYPTSAPLTLGAFATYTNMAAAAVGFTAVQFTVTDSGKVEDLGRVASSLSPSFDHNVVVAVRAAGAAGLPPVPRHFGHSAVFQLEVETVVEGDTTPDRGDTLGAVRMRWVGTTIPVWNNGVHARGSAEREWLPYPVSAERHGAEDSVLVQYVIGADGRVAPGTAILLHATYRDFVRAVSDRLSSFRLQPTTIGGCPVAALARQAFTFKIERY